MGTGDGQAHRRTQATCSLPVRIYAQSAKKKKPVYSSSTRLSGAFGGNENDRTAVYDFVSSFRGWGDTARVCHAGHWTSAKRRGGKKIRLLVAPFRVGRPPRGRCGCCQRRAPQKGTEEGKGKGKGKDDEASGG